MGRVILLVFVAGVVWGQGSVKFMGRVVTVTEATYDADDPEHFQPKGPATVCLEGTPRPCYATPDGYGRAPEATVAQINKNTSALLFSAASGGVSQIVIHFALLRPGKGNEFENLFPSDLSVTNQSEHAWWMDATISSAKMFVTADYVWGPGECHYCDHRYMISAYVLRSQKPLLANDNWEYALEDRYMTVRKYRSDENSKILQHEKPEIIARLKRVKQQSPRQK
jgi:hypothetical protein